MNALYPVANPVTSGHFDTWFTTEAEVSSSMSNCGCYKVDNGPMPAADNCTGAWPTGDCMPVASCRGAPTARLPSGGTRNCNLTYEGDQCVVAKGVAGKWAYPCTDYYYPNASDPRTVSGLADWRDPGNKIPGDDSVFIVEKFTEFLDERVHDSKPWLAHLCLHSIHEPHPAMPEFYSLYENDPDYLGTLTQMDAAIGVLRREIDSRGMGNNTVVFMTTDNGCVPRQGGRAGVHRLSRAHTRTYLLPPPSTSPSLLSF